MTFTVNTILILLLILLLVSVLRTQSFWRCLLRFVNVHVLLLVVLSMLFHIIIYSIYGMFMMILKTVIAHLNYDSKCRLLRELTLLKTISANSKKITPVSLREKFLLKCLSLSSVNSMIQTLAKLVQTILFAPSMLPPSSEVDSAQFEEVSDHWTPDPFYPPHNF